MVKHLCDLYKLLESQEEADIKGFVLNEGHDYFYRLRIRTRGFLDRLETENEKEEAISFEKIFQCFYSKIIGKLHKNEKVGLEIERLKNEWKRLEVILKIEDESDSDVSLKAEDERDSKEDSWLNPKYENFKDLVDVIINDDRQELESRFAKSARVDFHDKLMKIWSEKKNDVRPSFLTPNPCFNSVYENLHNFLGGKNVVPVKFFPHNYFVVNAPTEFTNECNYENAVKESKESYQSSQLPLIKYEDSLDSIWKNIYETEKELPVILSDARSMINLVINKNLPVTIKKYGKSFALTSNNLLYNKKGHPEAYLFNTRTLKKEDKTPQIDIFYTMKVDYFLSFERNKPESFNTSFDQPRGLINNYPEEIMDYEIDQLTWDEYNSEPDFEEKKDLFEAANDTIVEIYRKYKEYNDEDLKLLVSKDDNNQLQYELEYW